MEQAMPKEWDAIVRKRVRYGRRLPKDKWDLLGALIRVFLDEKPFEGCGGLEITDEVRLTVAGHACVLLLGGQSDIFPKLRTILVYPHAYLAPHSTWGPDGTLTEGLEGRSGESWSFGNIVLSWDDVLRDASRPHSGRNVVFHEFAHQLDFESGLSSEAPDLPRDPRFADWVEVLEEEYEALIDSARRARPSLLDKYGATDPAEFFAVATECFFLKPAELKARHPKLYSRLMLYYRQDPSEYFRS